MRLRRRASTFRAIGWANCGLSLVLSGVHTDAAPALIVWAVGVMSLSYALAHVIDKQADRVITR